MTQQTYAVSGMTCASCVRHVEKALKATPGVSEASVNLATSTVRVEGTASFEDMALQVEDAGYGLKQVEPDASAEASLQPALRRMVFALVLTSPLFVTMIPGLAWHMPGWLQALLATPVVFGSGLGFFARAVRLARRRQVSMDTLIALGSGTAWTFAVIEWWQGAHHLSFESASALVAFLLTGKYLEARAKSRATDALKALLDLAPSTALQIQGDGSLQEVPVSTLHRHDRVRVLPGQAVPADGRVSSGQAEADESMVTGEPMPVPKAPGDFLAAGTVIHGSMLEVEMRIVR